MKPALADHAIARQPPLVVEIVGSAGAGKTTLSKALSRRNPRIVTGVHLSKIGFVPFFIQNTLFFLPTFLRQYRHSRWFTWKETRAMVYLKAWHQLLRRQAPNHNVLTVLDDGPIFRLVRLREFGPEMTESQLYKRWWANVFDQWAATLDVVIWLEAPYEVLAKRIVDRRRWHRVKGKPQQEVYEFLAHYRAAYEQVLSELTAHGSPQVLRFDTHREALDQIVDKVLAALNPELQTMDFLV